MPAQCPQIGGIGIGQGGQVGKEAKSQEQKTVGYPAVVVGQGAEEQTAVGRGYLEQGVGQCQGHGLG